MPQDKFVIMKLEDVVQYLSPQEKQNLLAAVSKVSSCRTIDKKRNNKYFVLNAADPYARIAMEAYVAAVDADEAIQTVPSAPAIKTADLVRKILVESRLHDKEASPT